VRLGELVAIAMEGRRVQRDPALGPRVPNFYENYVSPTSPEPQNHPGPVPEELEDSHQALCKLATTAVTVLEEICGTHKPLEFLLGTVRTRVDLCTTTHHGPTDDATLAADYRMIEPEALRESLYEPRDSLAPLGGGGWGRTSDVAKDGRHFIYMGSFDAPPKLGHQGAH
jgi:hypothetical protein